MTGAQGNAEETHRGRFRKGQSGNPKGRPKKARLDRKSAFDVVFDRRLRVTRGGEERELTVEEALQHQTLKDALAGKRSAQREVIKMIARREAHLAKCAPAPAFRVVHMPSEEDPDNADAAMLLLGIAERNESRGDWPADRERLLLAPWAVQAALSRRRGGSKLTGKQISEIKRCTRDPDQLRWPRGTEA